MADTINDVMYAALLDAGFDDNVTAMLLNWQRSLDINGWTQYVEHVRSETTAENWNDAEYEFWLNYTGTEPPAFSPLDLSPALWVDPSDAATVTISGSSGAYIGASGLVLPGSATNYASIPDIAAHRGMTTIDIIVKVTAADWTAAASQSFLFKGAGGANGYGLGITTAGLLYFTNHITTVVTSTAAVGFTDGTTQWVRVLATQSVDAIFYTSPDGVTWTQLGTTLAYGATFGANTAVITLGNRAGGEFLLGTIHRAQIWNGNSTSGGTIVFDADFESATPFVSAFTESALGAPVYVVSSTATSATANYGYIGPEGLVLPGTNNDNASLPAGSTYDVTGDIDIVVHMTMPDWTHTARGTICGTANASLGYRLCMGTNGRPIFTAQGSGGDHSATAAVPFTDGQDGWVRVTRTASPNEVKFYTSTDGTSWTQLGSTVSTTTSLLASSLGFRIGSTFNNTEWAKVTVHRVKLGNAIDVWDVLDADFATAPDYAASFTESSSNAATVTITATNTPANAAGALVSQINDKSGNARHLVQGTASNMPKYWNGRNGLNIIMFDGVDNFLKTASGDTLSAPFGVSVVVMPMATVSANGYIFDSYATAGDVVLSNLTSTSLRIYAGTNVSASSIVTADRLALWSAKVDGASSTLRQNNSQVATGNAGSNALELVSVGAANGGTVGHRGLIGELVFWPTAASFTDIESYLQSKWSTP